MTTICKTHRRFINIEVEGDRYLLSISNLNEHSKTDITLNREQLTIVRDEITKYLDATKPPVVGELMVGRRVVTTQEAGDQSWAYDQWRLRKWGVQGVIVSRHTSHGECFAVQHDTGDIAYYNPEELELV